MRTRAALLLVVALATPTVVVSAKPLRSGPAEAKSDQNLLKGLWTVTSVLKDNYDYPQGDKVTYTFRENELLIHGERVDAPAFDEKPTYKLDSTKTPKQIDIISLGPKGDKKVFIFKGIYELEGDTLRICKAIPGEARPTKFTTKIGIVTLRRKIP